MDNQEWGTMPWLKKLKKLYQQSIEFSTGQTLFLICLYVIVLKMIVFLTHPHVLAQKVLISSLHIMLDLNSSTL